jgi:hypothetical protein
MTNNGIVQIHGKDYMTVAKRVELAHSNGTKNLSITTDLIPTTDNAILFKATVVTDKGTFTGYSAVDVTTGKLIEKSNPYEVAETSAVGRALGFAGYGIVESIASADEMAKAGVGKDESEVGDYSREPVETPDRKVCSAHDKPIAMLEGESKTKKNADGSPKKYWWHKDPEQGMCFGSGYQA